MTSARTKRPQPIRSLGPWRLIGAALREFRNGWKPYVAIIAAVIIPVDLIGLFSITSDTSIGVYSSFATIIMNVALLWTMVQKGRTGVFPQVHKAYYDGSIVLVRFLVVCALVVGLLIPAVLGAALFAFGQMAFTAYDAPFGEQAILALACSLFAIPSIWMLARFGLAPFVVVDTNLRPMAAMRYARRLTLGHFWRIFGHYVALALFLILLSIPIAAVTALLAFLKLTPLATLFFQLATTFTALPLANLYLLRLYRNLEPKSEAKVDPEPTAEPPEVEPTLEPSA